MRSGPYSSVGDVIDGLLKYSTNKMNGSWQTGKQFTPKFEKASSNSTLDRAFRPMNLTLILNG